MILLLRRWRRTVLDGSDRQGGRHPLLEQFVGDIDDRAVAPSGLHDVADLHLDGLGDLTVDADSPGRAGVGGQTAGLEDPNRP